MKLLLIFIIIIFGIIINSKRKKYKQKKKDIKDITIPYFFSNDLVKQGTIKNTDYIKRFANMRPVIHNVKYNSYETNNILKQYNNHNIFPFNKDEYNNFIDKFYSASYQFDKQIRGYRGEERTLANLKYIISNNYLSNFYCKILYDVTIPFQYKSNKNGNQSVQIDVLLICNYGIYALEVKNYSADQIVILGEKTNNNKQSYDRISSKKYSALVPAAYIKEKNNNKKDKTMDNFNKISHQTYIHRQALVEFLQDYLKISPKNANLIVYSPMVYANKNVDENGYDVNTKESFYLGNKVISKSKNGWNAWKVTALSYKNILNWITHNKNADSNALNISQINQIYSLLKNQVGVKKEIPHKMMMINNLEKFNNFIYQWNNYNKKLKYVLNKYILEHGIVKCFYPDKGYGFIKSNKGDIFVHYSEINLKGYKTLKYNQKVSFDIKKSDKGIKAVNVTPIE